MNENLDAMLEEEIADVRAALQASAGYDEVLAAALAPKHEPRTRLLTDGKTTRIWCSCQSFATGKNVRGREAARQAVNHIVDAHNRGES